MYSYVGGVLEPKVMLLLLGTHQTQMLNHCSLSIFVKGIKFRECNIDYEFIDMKYLAVVVVTVIGSDRQVRVVGRGSWVR